MIKRQYKQLIALLLLFVLVSAAAKTQAQTLQTLRVLPGDTWHALSWRFATNQAYLRDLNPTLNKGRQPIIGSEIVVPADIEYKGRMIRPNHGSAALAALSHNIPLAEFVQVNQLQKPYLTPHRALFIPDGITSLREFPVGLTRFELSAQPAVQGQALALRGVLDSAETPQLKLDSYDFDDYREQNNLLALIGLGAFFSPGTHEISIVGNDGLRWQQPLLLIEGAWQYQEITYTGAAAQIDNNAIQIERARLFEIWALDDTPPQWTREFQFPIDDYVYLSSPYGTRRSYDGGASYNTYHEGVDFAAYEGTPVYATAAGTVVVAETLYVRGGAVIIDHGAGVYSGVYHLSTINVAEGDYVQAGDLVGGVGTTGLSTGNHLHWDLLVGETWVGADKWVEAGLGCWLLAGLDRSCN